MSSHRGGSYCHSGRVDFQIHCLGCYISNAVAAVIVIVAWQTACLCRTRQLEKRETMTKSSKRNGEFEYEHLKARGVNMEGLEIEERRASCMTNIEMIELRQVAETTEEHEASKMKGSLQKKNSKRCVNLNQKAIPSSAESKRGMISTSCDRER